MQVCLYKVPDINVNISSRSELTADKILSVLVEDTLLVSKPVDEEWFKNLKDNIIVYMPNRFKCALIPIL